MSAWVLECMVVVVPAFPLSKNTNYGIVHRKVVSFEHLTSINVTDRIDGPGNMPYHNLSHSEAPDNSWKSSQQKVNERLGCCDLKIVLFQELIVLLVGKIFDVLLINQNDVGPWVEHPAHVRPPEAIIWTMWVCFTITISMVMSMSRAPFDWVTLNSKNSYKGKNIFYPFWRLKASVSKLSMVRKGDALTNYHVAPECPTKCSRWICEWS